MKHITILTIVLAVACFSCQNSKQNNPNVLSPLSQHIVGIWDMVESLEQTADGWQEEPLPDDYRYVMNYRADGNIEGTLTENGHTGTGVCPYEVDDSQLTITQMWRTFHVEKLTKDSLVVVFEYSPGPEAQDSIVCRCTYLKIPEFDPTANNH